jgi:serine/threonine-protein kinase
MSQVHSESLYGHTAVSLGCATEAQVSEGIQIQARMRDMGIDTPLSEILVKKGFLTAQGHSSVLKKLGVQTSPIPGYTLLGKIGQGGMGTVYKALQASVNRTVAIKIMSPAATKDKTYVARFLQEAQSTAHFNHKNLITAIDVGVSNGLYYFVMEFATGKNCRETLNLKGAFDEKLALDVAIQMAGVLDHIHQNKMVHRDIKPENMILTNEGIVKLCDLGLAKSTTSMEQSLTQEGLAVGTPHFMSPEQIRGDKDIDIRADLYSLGATLYFMVTGRHPYNGKSAAETMSMHLNQPIPDPRKHAPQLREDFGWIIHKLMAKDRAQRYQTPAELLDDLRKAHSGKSASLARQHAAKVQLREKARAIRPIVRKTVAVWPFVAIGAIAIGLGVWIALRETPPAEPLKEVVSAPAREPEAPSGPKDDPRKLGEAAGLFSTADQLFKQERWKETLAELNKLKKQYAELEYTQGRMAEIGGMIGTCEGKMRGLESSQALRIEDARAAMREGRWQDAQTRLQDLAKTGHSDLQGDLDQCRREIDAEAAVQEIHAARDGELWPDLLAKILMFDKKHETTQTIEKCRTDLELLAARAMKEQETGKFLADAHAAAIGLKWKQLDNFLVEIEKLRETATYRKKEGEIRDLRTKLTLVGEAAAEETATRAWIPTQKSYGNALQEKDYDQATETLQAFLKTHGATRVAKGKETEINAKMADLAKRKAKDRDDEARKVWAAVQKDFRAQDYATAVEGIARLIELSDTPTYKTYERAIQQNKQVCDQHVFASHLLVEMDFEDLPGFWNAENPATAENTANEPHRGKRSARISLPPDSWVTHRIRGISERAETITFYARFRGPKGQGAKVDFFVNAGNQETFGQWRMELSFTTDWRPYTVRLTELTHREKKVLNPAFITAFGFAQESDSGPATDFQIDTLRVETARGK